jgi:hypothetical protein
MWTQKQCLHAGSVVLHLLDGCDMVDIRLKVQRRRTPSRKRCMVEPCGQHTANARGLLKVRHALTATCGPLEAPSQERAAAQRA